MILQYLWIIKDNLGDQHYVMKDSDGSICKYRIDTNIEQLISLSNKQNLLLQKIAYFANLVNFSPSNKV